MKQVYVYASLWRVEGIYIWGCPWIWCGFDIHLLYSPGGHNYCTCSLPLQLQNHVRYTTCMYCYHTAIMHPLILQSGIGIIFVVKCFTSVTYILRFKFPSILLVYYISIPIILDVTHFIGLAGRRSLFCRSDSLFDDPTPFCSFTGTELDLRLTSLYSFINFICLQLSPIYFYIPLQELYTILCTHLPASYGFLLL